MKIGQTEFSKCELMGLSELLWSKLDGYEATAAPGDERFFLTGIMVDNGYTQSEALALVEKFKAAIDGEFDLDEFIKKEGNNAAFA